MKVENRELKTTQVYAKIIDQTKRDPANKNHDNIPGKLTMQIIEREGRYFMQCTDGEVELTSEDIATGAKAATVWKEYGEAMKDSIGHRAIGDASTPYVFLDQHFLNIKKAYQKMYDEDSDKNGAIRDLRVMTSLSIDRVKLEILKPNADKDYLNYILISFEHLMKFVELFELYTPTNLQPATPQPNHEPELLAGKNQFCPSMEMCIAIDHFKVFKEKNNSNGQPFLSTEQFDLFIQKAFYGKNEIPKQSFNVGSREKLFIIKRFYEFYCIGVDGHENTSQCQGKYVKLMTDNFTNWAYQDIKSNFGNKVKRSW